MHIKWHIHNDKNVMNCEQLEVICVELEELLTNQTSNELENKVILEMVVFFVFCSYWVWLGLKEVWSCEDIHFADPSIVHVTSC